MPDRPAGQSDDGWAGPRWVRIPLPEGKSDEVYALITGSLSEDEKAALADYLDWYLKRDAARDSETPDA